ncbi:MAG TPA: gamma-glutamyltransferase [candidate division Zixibacteria bacterium]|nr:gamma-glutamyltransferase [candidate division Zixibacteria bacterium]
MSKDDRNRVNLSSKLIIASIVTVAVLATVAFAFFGCSGVGVSHLHENGVVATSSPVATRIGLQVLQQGGNAFDAAVAVGFALAVAYPEAGNIGGGGFALVYEAESGQVRALDFRETAPAAATEKMYQTPKGDVIPNASTLGAKAAGVPGTVAGLHVLWKEYGSRTWEELVTLAAELADSGLIVDNHLAASLDDYQDSLTTFTSTAAIFAPGGRILKAGDRLVQTDLANTLSAIATDGPDGFYSGETAQRIIDCMKEHGGIISAEDLTGYQPVWREPLSFDFGPLKVYSMPPPSSGGICLGQILKLLEPYDFSVYSATSPEYIHLFCEAAKLAYADRSEHLGDPEFWTVPDKLLDKNYLDSRRRLIDSTQARPSDQVRPGIFGSESDQTTHFSILDADGNIVSMTYTINTTFGSKLVVDGAGFLLNNEMDDFSIKPGEPNVFGLVGGEANKIEPGKRMLSSMSPTIVFRSGKPCLVLGSPGGSKIITTVAQTIINIERFGMSLQEAVDQPRYHHQWLPDIVYLEEGKFSIQTKQGLIGMGHVIKERTPFGDVQAIMIRSDGLYEGASDPRENGLALGY